MAMEEAIERDRIKSLLAQTNEQLSAAGRLGQSLLERQQELEKKLSNGPAVSSEENSGDELDVSEQLRKLEYEVKQVAIDSSMLSVRNASELLPPMPGTPSRSTLSASGLVSPSKNAFMARKTKPSTNGSDERDLQNEEGTANLHAFASEIGQSLLNEVRKLQSALAEKDEVLRGAQRQRVKAERAQETSERRLKTAQEAAEQLKDENWTLEVARQDISNQLAELQQTAERLSGEKRKVDATLAAKVEAFDALYSSKLQLDRDFEEQTSKHDLEVSTLRRTREDLESIVNSLQQHNQNLEAEISKANDDLARALERISELELGKIQEKPQTGEWELDESIMPAVDASPVKLASPTRGGLESETMGATLAHAHRLLAQARGNAAREKQEKIDIRRQLAKANKQIAALKDQGPKQQHKQMFGVRPRIRHSDSTSTIQRVQTNIVDAEDKDWEHITESESAFETAQEDFSASRNLTESEPLTTDAEAQYETGRETLDDEPTSDSGEATETDEGFRSTHHDGETEREGSLEKDLEVQGKAESSESLILSADSARRRRHKSISSNSNMRRISQSSLDPAFVTMGEETTTDSENEFSAVRSVSNSTLRIRRRQMRSRSQNSNMSIRTENSRANLASMSRFVASSDVNNRHSIVRTPVALKTEQDSMRSTVKRRPASQSMMESLVPELALSQIQHVEICASMETWSNNYSSVLDAETHYPKNAAHSTELGFSPVTQHIDFQAKLVPVLQGQDTSIAASHENSSSQLDKRASAISAIDNKGPVTQWLATTPLGALRAAFQSGPLVTASDKMENGQRSVSANTVNTSDMGCALGAESSSHENEAPSGPEIDIAPDKGKQKESTKAQEFDFGFGQTLSSELLSGTFDKGSGFQLHVDAQPLHGKTDASSLLYFPRPPDNSTATGAGSESSYELTRANKLLVQKANARVESDHTSESSSFGAHVDHHLNHASYEAHFAPKAAPVIQAVTHAMIGDYMWKYTRNRTKTSISEHRHQRYFWIQPYTRTLYWSARNPALAEGEIITKSASIESVRVIADNNPQPIGLHCRSIIIVTPHRAIKFTAGTQMQHDLWFEALSAVVAPESHAQQNQDAEGEAALEEELREVDPSRSSAPRSRLASHSCRHTTSDSSHHAMATMGTVSSLNRMGPWLVEKRMEKYSLRDRQQLMRSSECNKCVSPRKARREGYVSGSSGRRRQQQQRGFPVPNENEPYHHHSHTAKGPLEDVRSCCGGKHNVATLDHRSMKRDLSFQASTRAIR